MAIEITDSKELEAWLQDKPKEWSALIAHRVALRVCPLMRTEWLSDRPVERKQGLTLAVLRANLFSEASKTWPTTEINSARGAATAVLSKYSRDGRVFSASALFATLRTADVPAAAKAAAVAADNAADPAPAAVWNSISTDLQLLEDKGLEALRTAPIWHSEQPDWFSTNWIGLKDALLKDNPNWQVWIDFLQRRFLGKRSLFDLASDSEKEIIDAIVKEGEQFWDRDAHVVNADLVARIEERRGAKETFFKDGNEDRVNPEQISEPEAQKSATLRFANDANDQIVIDENASSIGLLSDQAAQERHSEVLRQCNRLVGAFDPNERGANAARELVEDVELYRNSLGTSASEAKPDFLVPRGDALREYYKAQKNKDEFSDLPTLSDKFLLGLDRLIKAHNQYVNLDPQLSARDEGLLGPDATKLLVDPEGGQKVVADAVRTGAANAEIEVATAIEAKVAPSYPDPNNRISRRYSEAIKNLARQVLGNALSFARLAWHHKGKVGTAGAGLLGAAKWALAHEAWLLETFANNPGMRKLIEQLLAFLKTLPL